MCSVLGDAKRVISLLVRAQCRDSEPVAGVPLRGDVLGLLEHHSDIGLLSELLLELVGDGRGGFVVSPCPAGGLAERPPLALPLVGRGSAREAQAYSDGDARLEGP